MAFRLMFKYHPVLEERSNTTASRWGCSDDLVWPWLWKEHWSFKRKDSQRNAFLDHISEARSEQELDSTSDCSSESAISISHHLSGSEYAAFKIKAIRTTTTCSFLFIYLFYLAGHYDASPYGGIGMGRLAKLRFQTMQMGEASYVSVT